jgi:hypothetical protein
MITNPYAPPVPGAAAMPPYGQSVPQQTFPPAPPSWAQQLATGAAPPGALPVGATWTHPGVPGLSNPAGAYPDGGYPGVEQSNGYAVPPVQNRSSRRRLVVFAAVLLLVGGGLITYLALPGGSGGSRQNAVPFYRAVENLFSQPMAHYTSSSPGGLATWDINAMRGGEVIGAISADGRQIGYLSVGGRIYLKLPPDLLAGALPPTANASALQGRWVNGGNQFAALLPTGVESPQAMASQLSRALDNTTNFPAPGTTVRVGSGQAYRVQTPQGTLVVSSTAPYHVLQFAPAPSSGAAAGGIPSSVPVSSGMPSTLSIPPGPASSPGAQPGGGSGGPASPQINFQPTTNSDVDSTFGDLQQQTAGLADAVDLGISLSYSQVGNLNCSDTACTVTESVRASTNTGKPAPVQGTVRTSMVANITLNGQAAGSCSATADVPVNGSGQISCVDGGVGPVVNKIRQQVQAQADAQADATGQDVEVPYTLSYSGSVDLEAMADEQADVDNAVNNERDEQNDADQQTGCEKAACQLAGTRRAGPIKNKSLYRGGSGSDAFGVNVNNPNPGRASAAIDVSAGGDTYYYNPANATWSNSSGRALPQAIANQIPQSVVDQGFKDLGMGQN